MLSELVLKTEMHFLQREEERRRVKDRDGERERQRKNATCVWEPAEARRVCWKPTALGSSGRARPAAEPSLQPQVFMILLVNLVRHEV